MTGSKPPPSSTSPSRRSLIVLGVAVLGVLVEAFVPRARRYLIQVVLALAGLVAAFVALGR